MDCEAIEAGEVYEFTDGNLADDVMALVCPDYEEYWEDMLHEDAQSFEEYENYVISGTKKNANIIVPVVFYMFLCCCCPFSLAIAYLLYKKCP